MPHRRIKHLFLACVGAACLLGSAVAQAAGDAPAVRAAMERFLDALNALDGERLAATFADDITAYVPSAQARRLDGKAAVMAVFRQYIDDTRKTTPRTNIVPQDLRVEAGDSIALVSFEVRGASSVARRSFVYRREGQAWLISHFHASNVAGN
jgi:uncharacterized protein (TIGR02246 family)